MANTLIQIKRSLTTANAVGLANGELAYSANGDVLWIGSNSTTIAIAGVRNPGTLTANQALVANATSEIDKVIVANVVVNQITANGSQGTAGYVLATSGPGANAHWINPSSFIGAGGANTQVQYNNSGSHAGSTGLTFDYLTNVFSVGNSISISTATINSTIYTGTANNANYLGGVIAANYVQNTDSRTLSGNLVFTGANLDITGANLNITSNVTITAANVDATGAVFNARDINLSGNLTVSGTLTTINTTSLVVKDPLIVLAKDNTTTDLNDIGFYGLYSNSTATWYSGLYKEHGTALDAPLFKLFASDVEPTTTVNNAAPNYTIGTLYAYLQSGALVSNTSTVSITANSTVNVNITANSITLSSALGVGSGGTGLNTIAAGSLVYGNSTGPMGELSVAANGNILQVVGNLPAWGSIDAGTF